VDRLGHACVVVGIASEDLRAHSHLGRELAVLADLGERKRFRIFLDKRAKARRAAVTAASTSSGPPSGTLPQGCSVKGSTQEKVFPDAAATHSPSMSIRKVRPWSRSQPCRLSTIVFMLFLSFTRAHWGR
jgi:hypothetical protein